MLKFVAVAGDTKIKTSTKKHASDTNSAGQWKLVSSTVTSGEELKVNGALVEISAQATWSYVGGTAGNTTVGPFPDSATLTAGTTRVKDKGRNILVDGDNASGSADGDNKIEVTASQSKLATE
jgi:hypothetical protein